LAPGDDDDGDDDDDDNDDDDNDNADDANDNDDDNDDGGNHTDEWEIAVEETEGKQETRVQCDHLTTISQHKDSITQHWAASHSIGQHHTAPILIHHTASHNNRFARVPAESRNTITVAWSDDGVEDKGLVFFPTAM
jgi:hypothetical protein